jgi:hypothetical protein
MYSLPICNHSIIARKQASNIGLLIDEIDLIAVLQHAMGDIR